MKCTRYAITPNPSAAVNGKVKTKIPVYLNSLSKSYNTENKVNSDPNFSQKKSNPPVKSSLPTNSSASVPMRNTKAQEKFSSCSLMNATKSSSAKMVTKIVRESPRSNKTKNTKCNSNSKRVQRRGENDPPMDIPVMERSGTFLKDEPTFGDKTTNIDLDQ